MKLNKIYFFTFMILSIVSCGQKEDFNSYINSYYSFSVDTISVKGLKNIQRNSQIIDSRSYVEYSTSKIKGAVFVDYTIPKTNRIKLTQLLSIAQ